MLNKIATATPKALPSFISQQMPEGIGVIGLGVFSYLRLHLKHFCAEWLAKFLVASILRRIVFC